MSLHLAVFDMIGTTVAAGPEVSEAFFDAFAGKAIALSPSDVDGVRGRSKREAVEALVHAHRPDEANRERLAEEIYAAFRSTLRARYETGSRAVPGARSTLEELQARGTRIILTTGLDRETATAIVRGLGWESLRIDGVLTGDDVARGRPAPDLIHASMARVGEADPSAVLAAGDKVSDLRAAASAKAGWSVGVASGAHSRAQLEQEPHSIILGSVADLPGWLSEQGVFG